VIINEAAANILGWNSALGKRIRVPEEEFEAQVIGVVKDFHFRSLHEKIGPMVLGWRANPIRSIDYFTVRIDGSDIAATLAFLEDVHNRIDKITPFEYNFLDERLQNYYQTDVRIGKLVGITALIAIVIACLGLFGLAAYTAEQRTKEIGIRKALGATAPGIFLLLSKEFTRLVFLAALVAIPIAYYALGGWLQNFAYHVNIGAGALLFSAGLALLISLLTISYQAIKSALVNPVQSLRYE
jgi:putative ABC transport system permease protein